MKSIIEFLSLHPVRFLAGWFGTAVLLALAISRLMAGKRGQRR